MRLSNLAKTAGWSTAILALAGAAAWLTMPVRGQGDGVSWQVSTVAADPQLDAGVPPPEQVFVEKTSAFPGRGNVLVSVEIGESQRSAKIVEGTEDFITIGDEGSEIILRDDGRGGDAAAGDRLYTAPAFIDRAELAERAQADQDAVTRSGKSTNFVFFGRSFGGEESVTPFDLAGFDAGSRVPLDPAIVYVEPAATVSETGTGTKSASRSLTSAAATAPKNCSPVAGPSPGTTNGFQERVLMIRNHQVVEDPARTINPCDGSGTSGGVWTFEHLMTEMANQQASGIDPSDFVEQWLATWAQSPGPTINGHTVSTRPLMDTLIAEWRADSGGGNLDLSQAPFRLSAIVLRTDLRTQLGGGGGYAARSTGKFLDAGELRFIFGIVLKDHWDHNAFPIAGPDIDNDPNASCLGMPATVILEYKVPRCNCPEVRDWASRWIELDDYDHADPIYRAKLERLTESVVRANADPTRPNGSAIGQVRTNEIIFPQAQPPHSPSEVWELREFQLVQSPFSLLVETTTADTPLDRYNRTPESPHSIGSPLLFDWIDGPVKSALVTSNDCAGPIPQVPLLFQGSLPSAASFLGANPHTETPAYNWDHPSLAYTLPFQNWARHRVSLAACSGCHGAETSTVFLQVDPQVPFGNPAALSGFLEGINHVPDPAAGTPNRHFDDLLRREDDVKGLAAISCATFHPVAGEHVRTTLAKTGALPDDLFQGLPVLPAPLHISASPDAMLLPPTGETH